MRRATGWLLLVSTLGLGAAIGCSAINPLAVRSQSPEKPEEDGPQVQLVRDLAVPFGLFPIQVEAVGLVTGLKGTGSDPPPSPQRAALIDEMQARGVEEPNTILASPSTSLVLVRGILRPGIQKGDRFDVEVRIPSRSETTSLRGGYLLETRLKPMALLPDRRIHEGHLLALAAGPVMVDPSADPKSDRAILGRGRILGGGVALKSRPLGLVLRPEHQSVVNSARVAEAVNRRFHTFDHGVKVGVATAKTDEYIEVKLHPRYKDDIGRYMRVIGAVALRETEAQRLERLEVLRDRLLDPATAADAALQLEAIGSQAVEVLQEGIRSSNTEVRFYAAEALAWLDRTEAAEPLAEIAREEPAFRMFALNALGAMDDYKAYDVLCEMLDLPSAETRYGAFRALCAMNPNDPVVRGERLGEQFSYHVLDTAGPPMIHVTHSHRPELVLFGRDQRLLAPLAINAGNDIMVTANGPDEITVSKYAVGEPDQRRVVSNRVDDVIRAIVELGGTYPDVVQALQEAKASGALTSRFEVDALPEPGRTYRRLAGKSSQEPAEQTAAQSQEPLKAGLLREWRNPLTGLLPRWRKQQ